MVAVAAVLVSALVLVFSPAAPVLASHSKAVVCSVVSLSPCQAAATTTGTTTTAGTTTGSTGGTDDQADHGDRRDQGRDTGRDRGRRGSDGSGDTGTTGTGTGSDPLGTPVAGEHVPTPDPPPWQPPDKGAGEYDSHTAWPWDHAKKLLIETAANLMAGKWPDASRNLLHYLANNGKPLDQDVNQILSDVPGFKTKTDELRTSLGEDAVSRARQAGATGPMTFPVSTAWSGYYISSDQSSNWFYALGGISYNETGQVTVYPPTSPGGAWRYEVSTQVNIRDQYNWDAGKSTDIGPITVSDKQMADLHLQGLAREYLNTGSSSTTTSGGTVK